MDLSALPLIVSLALTPSATPLTDAVARVGDGVELRYACPDGRFVPKRLPDGAWLYTCREVRDKAVERLSIVFGALATMDATLTTALIQGGREEKNPVLRGLTDKPAIFGLVKGALTTLILVVTNRYMPPEKAKKVLWFLNAIYGGAVVNNAYKWHRQ